MNRENTKKLVESFPILYGNNLDPDPMVGCKQAHRLGRMYHSFEAFGFECGNGWFQLLWDLSEKLMKIIEKYPENERKHFHLHQVKEKFGTLRYYMASETDEMSECIREAEQKSAVTCEECGEKGVLAAPSGWYVTLCEDHWVKYIQERHDVSVEEILEKVRKFGEYLEEDDA